MTQQRPFSADAALVRRFIITEPLSFLHFIEATAPLLVPTKGSVKCVML
jgi:hypothetical protein